MISKTILKLHNKQYVISLRQNTENKRILPVFLAALFNVRKSKIIDFKKIEDYLISDNKKYLVSTLESYNQIFFNENYNWARFKRSYRRFGSLSSKRNINISYRLLFAPKKVFEYVCVHELAHLKEFNHSKKFWEHVKRAMPDYKKCDKWLRDNGNKLTIENNLKVVSPCDKNDKNFIKRLGA